MIDASLVMVEQIHKKLKHWESEGRHGSRYAVLISSIKEAGGPSFLRFW